MKKITKRAEPEESVYYSDFSDVIFDDCGPHVHVKFEFGYGSRFDDSSLTLHLTDDDVQVFLNIIKERSTNRFKESIETTLKLAEDNYEDSMQMRDWDYCDRVCNNISLYRELLNKK